MLLVWYAIVFQFNSNLGDFPFLFFTLFKTCQSSHLIRVMFRVGVWVSVRASVRVSFRVNVRLGL